MTSASGNFWLQDMPQHGRRPVWVGAFRRERGEPQIAQQMAEFAGERRVHWGGSGAAATEPHIVNRPPQRPHPAPCQQYRDQRRESRREKDDPDKHDNRPDTRFRSALLDERKIVH